MKAPRQSLSNEYPQHMFSWRNKKNIYLIPTLIYTYDFKNAFNSIFSSSEYWPFQILISNLKNASVLGADCFEKKSLFTQNWSVKYMYLAVDLLSSTVSKIWTSSLPADVSEKKNSVDPDQILWHLIRVYTVQT